MENMETLDSVQQPHQDLSKLKTLSILTIVGNGLLMLLLIGVGLMASSFATSFGFNYSAAGVFMAIMLIFSIIPLLCILGAVKMMKGKKSGYLLYLIPNCLYILVSALGFVIQMSEGQTNIMGLVTGVILPISFIIMFSKEKVNMR